MTSKPEPQTDASEAPRIWLGATPQALALVSKLAQVQAQIDARKSAA